MLSRLNLVAILLTLNCVIRAMERPRSMSEKLLVQKEAVASGKVLRDMYSNVTSTSPLLPTNNRVTKDKPATAYVEAADTADSKIGVEERDRPRRRKRRMDRTMLALLMAYKLKFIALIPTMLGGLILLKGTTLLAGFFFALFAAVLGLKIH